MARGPGSKRKQVASDAEVRAGDKNPDDFETGAMPGSDGTDASLADRIRHRAYQIWEESGRPEGGHTEHWLQAEREIAERGESGSRVGVPGETAGTVPGAGPQAPAQPGISAELGGSPSAASMGDSGRS